MLTLKDLESSSSNDDMKSVLDGRENLQALRKEKQKLNQKIQSLENDLEVARRAKEVSEAAAVRLLRKLRELFGNSFENDQLVDKIVELQGRVQKSKSIVDDLTIQINIKQKQNQTDLLSSKLKANTIETEKSNILDEIQSIQSNIDQLQQKIVESKDSYEKFKEKYDSVLKMKQQSPKLNIYPTSDILKWIEENSDESFNKICKKYAKIFGIDYQNPDVLANDIENAFANLNKIKASSKTIHSDLSKAVQEIIQKREQTRLKHKEMENIYISKKHEFSSFSQDSSKELVTSIEQYNKTKKRKLKHISIITETISKASLLSEIKVDMHDEFSGICRTCIEFSNEAKQLIKELSYKEDNINFEIIQQKINSVKQQNNLLIQRLQIEKI
ncbi:hypothetical protein TVAG_268420 [Trichomonas vaginalis G3]|uniref:Uncharacterized protein n=1 Tax=Trichomonas vaginalis (strain ATCC PRA-98 / G3) TaxID=412133 RepID=A2DLJ1_TRIV3|nr:hypothetical protein TVAGG3_0013220 [Trichomonas vaginalis G3]EAY18809.1 hypothetical protein TVAG_268420 [Trichomonas vaginalis G3]KAI5539252.1 hypothetical protein TVAGG3_0013220 [Trichomonas vaginalis G3]|eukprot:XP_001579795.1 hypothetical protein [Trichomonas vaginalis G3]